MKNKKRILFIILFFVVIGGSVPVVLYFSGVILQGETEEEHNLRVIQTQINNELNIAEQGLDDLQQVLEKGNRFNLSDFEFGQKYSSFIFRGGRLVFWSDNRIYPSYNLLNTVENLKIINFRFGKYLVLKQSFTGESREVYELFALMPLYFDSPGKYAFAKSGLNESIFKSVGFEISENPAEADYDNIYSDDGEFLFAVTLLEKSQKSYSTRLFIATAALLFLILLYFVLRRIIDYRVTRFTAEARFLLLLLFLTGTRWLMLEYKIPFSIIEFGLFNSRYYASSLVAPSIGDLFFNMLCLAILAWHFVRKFYRWELYDFITSSKNRQRGLWLIAFTAASCFLMIYVSDVFSTLLFNSQWSLDITKSIDFDLLKITSLPVVIMISFVYFFITHLFTGLIHKIFPVTDIKTIAYFLLGLGAAAGVMFFWDAEELVLIPLAGFYLFVLYFFRFSKAFHRVKYNSFLYLFFCAFVCAIMYSYGVYDFNQKKITNEKHLEATKFLAENDILVETFIHDISEKIRSEEIIKRELINKAPAEISSWIRSNFRESYFIEYNLKSFVYDSNGRRTDTLSDYANLNYGMMADYFTRPEYSTDYPSIYFVKDNFGETLKRYMNFNAVRKDGVIIGYIILEVEGKALFDGEMPYQFFSSGRIRGVQENVFSYSRFKDGEFSAGGGTFNYEKKFDPTLLNNDEIFDEGIRAANYHHLAVDRGNGTTIIISSPLDNIPFEVFSNFSFYFLLLTLVAIFVMLGYALYYRILKISINFVTKIQVYLNVAFFLPLLVISIFIIGFIGKSYRSDLNKSFIDKAHNISQRSAEEFEEYISGNLVAGDLKELLTQIAGYTGTGINIYGINGRLLGSDISDEGLLSDLINPQAYAAIIENNEKNILLQEETGSLKYNAVYSGIRSRETNRLIGVLSIPFFESKSELEKRFIDITTTIMNIFVVIFMLFLIVSYFASGLLTHPLQLITQNLRRTTLSDDVDPIEWKSDDEIGVLVNSYNEMLVKLKESKIALSRTEKESAWREMAKQVAHEIKNPLTPMKLKLQHMKRVTAHDEESIRTIEALLEQIDLLSDIASSFSSFAEMPVPEQRKIELTSITKKALELYEGMREVKIKREISEEEITVSGDSQLLGRIIGNLIINGLQAIPNNRPPEISIRLYKSEENAVIEIQDNGLGIPENIKNQVFIPSFSTKYSGSGIGLAVSKRGIEQMGGRIWFETQENRGTTFFIELPLSKDTD